MRRLTLAAAITLVWAGVALAQDIDVQCRIASPTTSLSVTSQALGANAEVGTYWNCNVPMPFAVPADRWVCITGANVSQYIAGGRIVGGNGAYAAINHIHPTENHDYHGYTFPPNVESATPMAFPPGHHIGLTIVNTTGQRVYSRVRVSGFLGRDGVASIEDACR